jgi:hypothetical protein
MFKGNKGGSNSQKELQVEIVFCVNAKVLYSLGEISTQEFRKASSFRRTSNIMSLPCLKASAMFDANC